MELHSLTAHSPQLAPDRARLCSGLAHSWITSLALEIPWMQQSLKLWAIRIYKALHQGMVSVPAQLCNEVKLLPDDAHWLSSQLGDTII